MLLVYSAVTLLTLGLLASKGYVYWVYNCYWAREGVPTLVAPRFPWGHLKDPKSTRRVHTSQHFQRLYATHKESAGGFMGLFFIIRPMVLVLDLDLVKLILVKQFEHFSDRGVYYNERADPLSAHLVALHGEPWRALRTKLTPTFTADKMKTILFPTVLQVAGNLVSSIAANGDRPVEIGKVAAQFTTDIIGTCAFGIDCNTLAGENQDFLEMSKRVFKPVKSKLWRRLLTTIYPDLSRWLGLKSLDETVSHAYYTMIRQTVDLRRNSGLVRNDFLQLLLELETSGELSFDQMAAQMFVFQVGGFETSSLTISYCCYELALNEQVQQKARAEISQVLANSDQVWSFDVLQQMTYLDQVVKETLRKYPPGASIPRVVTRDYRVPASEATLRKGVMVVIPVFAIHHDPDIYPDPHQFDPSRFDADHVRSRHNMAYLPFGAGPRACIATRFASMVVKLALAKLLLRFDICKTEKTVKPLEFNPNVMILTPSEEIVLEFKPFRS